MRRESIQEEFSEAEFSEAEFSEEEFIKEKVHIAQYYSIYYTLVKQDISVKSKHPKSLRYNLVNALWEELEYFLMEDEDFKIEKIENNSITIKALRRESFHNFFVMAKIIGKIVPFNGSVKLKTKEFRAPDFVNDMLIYNFTIKTDFGNFYKGTIYIVK